MNRAFRIKIISAIKYELAKGKHTFTICECGRHVARSNLCWECLLEKLEKGVKRT